MDHDFPQHTVDLARALRRGDIAAAEMALDMMVRDRERPTAMKVAKGRAFARRGAKPALPLLDEAA